MDDFYLEMSLTLEDIKTFLITNNKDLSCKTHVRKQSVLWTVFERKINC